MTDPHRPVPPLWLERDVLGLLTEEERAQLAQCCSDDERARFAAEHELLRRELLARRPAAEFAREVRARHARASARPHVGARVLVLAAALAVLALVGRSALEREDGGASVSGTEAPQGSGERAKGLLPSLRVYRKGAEGPELLAYGAEVAPGDVLQLGYLAPGMTHAILLSIDGRGEVTLHFPREGQSSRVSVSQGEQLLPTSYELDDAPSFERFVLLASQRPLRPADALRAARQLSGQGAAAREGALALPADVWQSSVLLRKAGP
jgi:hypothetical protein